jgi:pimeloyl-ACP methyl ester carboxylesterase
MDVRELEIRGYDGAAVPCVLHGTQATEGIAVVLPGGARSDNRLGGTPARPDLHFTRALLLRHGLAVLEVWWDAGSAPDGDIRRWLEENGLAAVREAAARGPVRALVGRSLGTGALAALVADPVLARTPSIWIAPLLRDESVRTALAEAQAPWLAVGGTSDPAMDVDLLRDLESAEKRVVLLRGADHGLQVEDPIASIRLLAKVLEAMARFVAEHVDLAPEPTS